MHPFPISFHVYITILVIQYKRVYNINYTVNNFIVQVLLIQWITCVLQKQFSTCDPQI